MFVLVGLPAAHLLYNYVLLSWHLGGAAYAWGVRFAFAGVLVLLGLGMTRRWLYAFAFMATPWFFLFLCPEGEYGAAFRMLVAAAGTSLMFCGVRRYYRYRDAASTLQRRVLRCAEAASGILLLPLLGLVLLGAAMEHEGRYRDIVAVQGKIDRGWIPPNIPKSALGIYVRSNPSNGTCQGQFSLSGDDLLGFKLSMEEIAFEDVDHRIVPSEEGNRKEVVWYRYLDFIYAIDWKARRAWFWLDYHHPDETVGEANPDAWLFWDRVPPEGEQPNEPSDLIPAVRSPVPDHDSRVRPSEPPTSSQ